MSFAPPLRRAAGALLGAGAVLAGLVGTAGPAAADPPPNCTTADMTGVMSGVSAAMSAYLFTHPDVNAFFTGLQGQSKAQIAAATQTYLDNNPQVRADIQSIRQPSTDFRARCGIGQRGLVPGLS
ncbi:MAG: heme-binding protein [Mycobacterium sp.]|nr:heme-binding protein [Mycobacterium sp.]